MFNNCISFRESGWTGTLQHLEAKLKINIYIYMYIYMVKSEHPKNHSQLLLIFKLAHKINLSGTTVVPSNKQIHRNPNSSIIFHLRYSNSRMPHGSFKAAKPSLTAKICSWLVDSLTPIITSGWWTCMLDVVMDVSNYKPYMHTYTVYIYTWYVMLHDFAYQAIQWKDKS